MSNFVHYQSTRGGNKNFTFEQVLLSGLARDGGLYVPNKWPSFSYQDLLEMKSLDYSSLATKIIETFVDEDIKPKLSQISHFVYSKFNHNQKAPIKELDNNFYVLELIHGPTFAFKDYAMQYLSELFNYVLTKNNKKMLILGATSGDTGSAALEAFKSKSNSDIFIFFPYGRVSSVQQKQMTSIYQNNAKSVAIKTDFDGCQKIVKNLFNDIEFRDKFSLTSVNSINWVRLIPQIVYYFYGALKVGAPDKKVIFSVPTGNFGNILAGWVALKMGLPIEKLICGSNQNDILTRFYNTGVMKRKEVIPSLSPSMDIQVSSNFERLLYELLDRDSEKLKYLMNNFEEESCFKLNNKVMKEFKKMFSAYRVEDKEILETIKLIYKKYNYIIDPHTAVGINAVNKAFSKNDIDKNYPVISLACAHPAKFPETIFKSIKIYPKNPYLLEEVIKSKERFEVIEDRIPLIKNYIINNIRMS